MRILTIVFLIALASCASKSAQESYVALNPELPTTCQEAIEKIAKEIDEQSVDTLKKTKKEDLVQFHFSWGMGIRNSYGLWDEESLIRRSCAEAVGLKDIHPDNASGIIMEGVWELINAKSM